MGIPGPRAPHTDQLTPVARPLAWLVRSPTRPVRALHGGLAFVLVLLGLTQVPSLTAWFAAAHIFDKDFLAIYAVSRAIADGANPLLPISVLAERAIPYLPYPVFPHPTPHPPTLALLALPLARFDYVVAAIYWLWIELACLAAALVVLRRAADLPLPNWAMPALVGASLAWYPIQHDLQVGQVNTILLLLLAGMWLAWRQHHPVVSGVLLGLTLLIKPITWPVLLVYLLRGAWRTLGGMTLTVLAGYGIAAWVVGPMTLLSYLQESLPAVTRYYQRLPWNQSLWSVGPRLFEGTTGIIAPPLVFSPPLAALVSVAVPATVLGLACLAIRRPMPLDWAIGVMICISIVINPLAWPHYWVLGLLPAALLLRWLIVHRFPARVTMLTLLMGLPMLIGYPHWERLAFALAGQAAPPHGDLSLPAAPALLTLVPSLAIVLLAGLIAHLGRRGQAAEAHLPAATRTGESPGRSPLTGAR